MKGPYERLKYDLRRLWQCPVCQRRERTSGAVTFRYCHCRMKQPDGKPVLMKLIADGVRRVGPPPPHLRSAPGDLPEPVEHPPPRPAHELPGGPPPEPSAAS